MPRSAIGPKTPADIRNAGDVREYLEDVGQRAQWVACPRCATEWNQLTMEGICLACIDRQQADAKHQYELGEYLRRTIGTYGIEQYSFLNWDITPENSYAFEAFYTFNFERQNLFVYGACGTGKTHLAGALFKASCAKNLRVKWTNPIWLSRQMRSRFASDEEAFVSSLMAFDVLIIDDLGVGKDTHVTLTLLYELLDRRRHQKMNGLVVTSNASLDELASGYKDDRITSRISGMCEIIQIRGHDRRLRK